MSGLKNQVLPGLLPGEPKGYREWKNLLLKGLRTNPLGLEPSKKATVWKGPGLHAEETHFLILQGGRNLLVFSGDEGTGRGCFCVFLLLCWCRDWWMPFSHYLLAYCSSGSTLFLHTEATAHQATASGQAQTTQGMLFESLALGTKGDCISESYGSEIIK